MTDRLKANRELVRRLYEEVFSAGRLDVVDELMTDDYVNHDPPPGAGHTREDVKVIATGFRERIRASGPASTGSWRKAISSRFRGPPTGLPPRRRSSSANSSASSGAGSPSDGDEAPDGWTNERIVVGISGATGIVYGARGVRANSAPARALWRRPSGCRSPVSRTPAKPHRRSASVVAAPPGPT